MLFKLAFRNIFRNFRRTFFTFLAIALGLALLIATDSYLRGLDLKTFEKIINLETGHLKILPKGYKDDLDNLPLENTLAPEKIMAALKQDPEIAGVAARINFRMTLSNGIDELPAVGLAIDPNNDENIFTLKEFVTQGQYFSANTEEALLIGKGLAQDFDVKVGETLTVLARTKYGTFQALDLPIKGIIQSEDYQIDYYSIVIPLGLAQKALDLGQTVTEIDLKLKNPQKIPEIKKKYLNKFSGTEIWTWEEVSEDVLAHSAQHSIGNAIIFSTIIIIALIGVSNTILISAFERTREIGMMAALGMKRKQIVYLFILEGSLIGLLGSLVGCLVGLMLVAFWTTSIGFDFSNLMASFGNIGFRSGKFLGAWNLAIFPVAFIFGILVSGLTSIYPAWVASRMEPTEALRKY